MVYDVIVIGAGPAGSVCSFFLAKAGLKTLLVEKHKLPRYKACGGSISWRIINELPYSARKALEEKIKKVEFYSPTMEYKAEYKYTEPIGHTTDREKFDALLVDRAEDAGAELLDNCMFKSLNIAKDYVGVKTSCGSFKSRFLVGADGTHSLVAKKAKIREKWGEEQLAFLVVSHFGSKEHDRETAKFYFGPNKAFNVGYGWIFPLSSSLNVGFGARLTEAKNLEKRFQEFVRGNEGLKDVNYLPLKRQASDF